jgi:hypothetical protein
VAPGESHPLTLRFAPSERGRTSSLLRFDHSAVGSAEGVYLYGEGVGLEYRDPTTFRTIASPNAIIPPKGSIVLGSYDLVGWLAGYVPFDGVMILGGGAIPLPDDWMETKGTAYAALGFGVKVGLEVMEKLNVAAGYVVGASVYDHEETRGATESEIFVQTPFASVSYGDDDSRYSVTAGYAFKTHDILGVGEIERDAMVLSLGGDYRVAERWKVVAEVLTMESLGYVPIAVTARYFGHWWALDAGLAYRGITTLDDVNTSPVLLPVVSWVMRF